MKGPNRLVELDLRGLGHLSPLASPHFHWVWPRSIQLRYLMIERRLAGHLAKGRRLLLEVGGSELDDVTILIAWCLVYWHSLGPKARGDGTWERPLWAISEVMDRVLLLRSPDPIAVWRLLSMGRPDDPSAEEAMRPVLDANARTLPLGYAGNAEIPGGSSGGRREGLYDPATEGPDPWGETWPAVVADALRRRDPPFPRYRAGGRQPLGRPRWGDGTARHGYGLPVFAECGYICVYCGLDMGASFENWLLLSVDHVVPRQMQERGYGADLVEDVTNLVTCCRPCNDLANRLVLDADPPPDAAAFYDLRDAAFEARRDIILRRRIEERAIYRGLLPQSADA